MTPEIERLAKEAGFNDGHCRVLDQVSGTWWTLEKFANLLAEKCAKLAEATTEQGAPDEHCETRGYASAAAIRAKFALSGGEDAAK